VKAAVFHSPGGLEVLSYEEAPDPKPGAGEAVVRVKACGVNRIDIWVRSGRYKANLPHVLGTDVAGEVEALGPGTTGLERGTPVVVYPVLSDGTCPYCLMGAPNRCISRGLVGVASDGGYAEFVKVPASCLMELRGLDFKTAAALPVNFGTAWNGLFSRARVGPGDTVLVWGAAGGLGHAAIQVSKHLGARVIAAVSSDEKLSFVESLGADVGINYAGSNIVEEVRAATEGYGATVVFDHIGGDTWATSLECLAKGGRLVTVGLTSGPRSDVDVRRVYQDELGIVGTYSCRKEELIAVLELTAKGKFRPAVKAELPLHSASEAHKILESRAIQGKILLVP
jgi:NADPH:quinone reductase-like Zn-dependent oxidoreductase